MSNIRIYQLPENNPSTGDFLVSDVQTSQGVYTTSRCHLSSVAGTIGQFWQSASSTLSTVSATWVNTTLIVNASAVPIWNSVYTTVSANSARWSSAYNTILSYKSNWDSAYNAQFFPFASITPATNNELVFEKTSNTVVTIKLKGSDGVVRSATINLT